MPGILCVGSGVGATHARVPLPNLQHPFLLRKMDVEDWAEGNGRRWLSIKGLFASEFPHGPSVALKADHFRDSGLRPCGSEGDPATECAETLQRMFCTDTALNPLLSARTSDVASHRKSAWSFAAAAHAIDVRVNIWLEALPPQILSSPSAP